MITEQIIQNILNGDMQDAVSRTQFVLYEKMNERLSEMKEYVAKTLYNEGCDNCNEGEDKKPDKESGAYKKFFRLALKKFGVSDPSEFKSDEEKSKFYNYLDNNWESDAEEATGKEDPTPDEENEVAAEKAANIKKMKRDNDNNEDEDEDEDE